MLTRLMTRFVVIWWLSPIDVIANAALDDLQVPLARETYSANS